MIVAVLGATGFLGAWCARALVAEGHTVIALARDSSDSWRLTGVDVELVRGPSGSWPDMLAGLDTSVVLNAAWDGVASADRDNELIQQRNVDWHRALVDGAYSAGALRFVGVGSQAEFGPVAAPIEDNRPTAPVTAYGRAKVAAHDSLAAVAADAGKEWAWARVFSVFGPLETGEFVLPRIARASAAGEQLAISRGLQPWSYLYAADAAEALALLIGHPAVNGAYNVAHPEAPPLRDSLSVFASALGSSQAIAFGEIDGSALVARTSRLEGLGWSPRVPTNEALAVTASWMVGDSIADPYSPGAILPLQR